MVTRTDKSLTDQDKTRCRELNSMHCSLQFLLDAGAAPCCTPIKVSPSMSIPRGRRGHRRRQRARTPKLGAGLVGARISGVHVHIGRAIPEDPGRQQGVLCRHQPRPSRRDLGSGSGQGNPVVPAADPDRVHRPIGRRLRDDTGLAHGVCCMPRGAGLQRTIDLRRQELGRLEFLAPTRWARAMSPLPGLMRRLTVPVGRELIATSGSRNLCAASLSLTRARSALRSRRLAVVPPIPSTPARLTISKAVAEVDKVMLLLGD